MAVKDLIAPLTLEAIKAELGLAPHLDAKYGKYEIGLATVAAIAKQTYTGSAITPTPVVTARGGTTLTKTTHYTVAYSDNTAKGTATITITGVSPYNGTLTAHFTIA